MADIRVSFFLQVRYILTKERPACGTISHPARIRTGANKEKQWTVTAEREMTLPGNSSDQDVLQNTGFPRTETDSGGFLSQDFQKQLFDRLNTLYRKAFGGIAIDAAHIARMTSDSLNEQRSRAFISLVENEIGRDLKGLRTLEIGAGNGLGVAMARKAGAEGWGLEPGTDEYDGSLEVARDILQHCGEPAEAVVDGVGENIPFADAHFDVVMSTNVLEHVDDPQRVIDESLRVLKPGGHLVIIVPNYGSWWEGHYGVLWLPHMPLWMARIYIRLLGRDPEFLDTLNFVSAGHLRKWLKPHANRLEIVSWGDELFRHRMNTLDFAEYGALGRLKRMVQILHRTGIVKMVTRICIFLNWQTPIVLVARRRSIEN